MKNYNAIASGIARHLAGDSHSDCSCHDVIGLSYIGGDFNMSKKAVAGIVVAGVAACAAIAAMVYSKISVR